MHRRLALAVGLLVAAPVTPSPAQAPPPPLGHGDEVIYRTAFSAAAKLRWDLALRQAAKAADPLPAKVIEWLYLQDPDSGAPFERIAAFIEANPRWPNRRRLRVRAEEAMADDSAPPDLFDWFARYPPVSGEGRLKLGAALIATGRRDEGIEWLDEAWRKGWFSARREHDIEAKWGPFFTVDLEAERLNEMLWSGNSGAARRALRRVGGGQAALGRARLALMVRAWNVDQLIARVPAELIANPGLVYERTRWRRRKGLHDKAEALLRTAPRTPAALVRPGKWWFERRFQLRRALGEGRNDDAYELARGHGLVAEADWEAAGDTVLSQPQSARARIAEAEWLAGWIALMRLGRPEAAYRHFLRVHAVVRFPVSVSRAAYWAGRAAEAFGDAALAAHWFAEAARHGTSYYGQLAALRAGIAAPPPAPAPPTPSPAEQAAYGQRELIRVLGLLTQLGEHDRLRPFVTALLAQSKEPSERVMLAAGLRDLGRPDLALRVARAAARDGLAMPDHAYPRSSVTKTLPGEEALLHAVIRQESGFYAHAESGAGALGLMQVMPRTARRVAARMKLAHDRRRLLDDPAYNARIGARYLGDLVSRFGGSYILALAAYNAGPRAVNTWLIRIGDPRDAKIDPVDWIETIPYRETRDYVQRVLEAVALFRTRLATDAAVAGTRPTLGDDLARGRRPPRPAITPRPRPESFRAGG